MKKLFAILISAAAFTLSGCYPGGPEDLEDFDVVLTKYSPEFNFKADSIKTFTLPSKVVKIGSDGILDPDGNNEPDYVKDAVAQVILSTIKTEMTNYGWTWTDDSATADLIILPSVMQTEYLYYYYDYWYWGWYYPGYPGYGWGYPGYYPPTYVSSYTTGTLLMQMTWPEGAALNVDDKIPVVWTGVVNGLVEGSQVDINQRISNSIQQAFEQSSYLQK